MFPFDETETADYSGLAREERHGILRSGGGFGLAVRVSSRSDELRLSASGGAGAVLREYPIRWEIEAILGRSRIGQPCLLVALLVWLLRATLVSRGALARENLALRQQLATYARTQKRPRLKPRTGPSGSPCRGHGGAGVGEAADPAGDRTEQVAARIQPRAVAKA